MSTTERVTDLLWGEVVIASAEALEKVEELGILLGNSPLENTHDRKEP